MSAEVFIYEREELEPHESYIWDILSAPAFNEVEAGAVTILEYDLEHFEGLFKHESGAELYIEDQDVELRIYDPEGLIRDEFAGLFSASTDRQVLE